MAAALGPLPGGEMAVRDDVRDADAAAGREDAEGLGEVRSADSAPADSLNRAVVAAMHEVGIDISATSPKLLTADAVRTSDVAITMGCGDTCPGFPGKRHLDRQLDDPAGRGVAAVRPIRDAIEARVRGLNAEPAGG